MQTGVSTTLVLPRIVQPRLSELAPTYLPIKIESVMPQEIAGTDAPLYTASGPSFVTVFARQS